MPTNFDQAAPAANEYGRWQARLGLEIPFIADILRRYQAERICDAGCAQGRHTVELARLGFAVTGVDPRPESIAEGVQLAADAGVDARFHVGEFKALADAPGAPFDAVFVFGNSLSLVGEWDAVPPAIAGIAAALRADGILITQTVNYHIFADPANRWKPLRQISPPPNTELLLKHFAPTGDDYITAEFIRLCQTSEGWTTEIREALLLSLTPERLESELSAHFEVLERFGCADGAPFTAEAPDLIAVAQSRTQ